MGRSTLMMDKTRLAQKAAAAPEHPASLGEATTGRITRGSVVRLVSAGGYQQPPSRVMNRPGARMSAFRSEPRLYAVSRCLAAVELFSVSAPAQPLHLGS